jgi:anti-sigma B factor antagonist
VTFTLTIERPSETVHLVAAAGELDAYTAPDVRARVAELIDGGARAVVCDLSRVTFLDSSGLGVLVGALKRLRERDGRLVVVRPAPPASRIFELTSLDRVLDLCETREDAVALATAAPA